MFICIEKNPNGSHAYQHGGSLQDGWAYWDTNKVPVPATFPYVDIVVEKVSHEAVTRLFRVPGKDGNMTEQTIVISPEYSQMEVVSATEREIPDPEPIPDPDPETESAIWDELDAAYQEGVDSV